MKKFDMMQYVDEQAAKAINRGMSFKETFKNENDYDVAMLFVKHGIDKSFEEIYKLAVIDDPKGFIKLSASIGNVEDIAYVEKVEEAYYDLIKRYNANK